MIAQLLNTNTPAIISCDADLTENYMYIIMKFRTGVHVFCWEVGVFVRSCFQSVSCNNCLGDNYYIASCPGDRKLYSQLSIEILPYNQLSGERLLSQFKGKYYYIASFP